MPMILTAALIPHGQQISIQATRIKICSLGLICHILVYSSYQYLNELFKAEFEGLLFEIIGVFVSIVIYIDSHSLIITKQTSITTETATTTKKNEQDDFIERFFAKVERSLNFLKILLIASTSAVLKYQPAILFAALVIENILNNFKTTAKYSRLINMLVLFYAIFEIIPYCIKQTSIWSNFAVFSVSMSLCLAISKQLLLKKVTGSIISMNSKKYQLDYTSNSEEFWKMIGKYPNLKVIFDKGWPFLIPFPLVIGIWSLAFFKSPIDSQILGLSVIIASSTILVPVNSDYFRFCLVRTSRICFAVLIFIYLLFGDLSSRLVPTFILLVLSAYFACIEIVYRILSLEKAQTNHSDSLVETGIIIKSLILNQIIRCLERVWTLTSPLISAFLIGMITIGTMNSKFRIILLILSAAAGLFTRSQETIFWFAIEAYIVVENSIIFFLSRNALPADLNRRQQITSLWNLFILLIAEIQRLPARPSIFSKNTFSARVHDSTDINESTESINTARDKSKLYADDNENYENSLLWKIFSGLGTIINFCSLLVLMGVLLFYPQIVDVTFQTCCYSLWAGLFIFLFYRPDGTANLRFWFIAALAVISGIFFTYNLVSEPFETLDTDKNIFFDSFGKFSEEGKVFGLHATIFWLSCISLFAMQITTKKHSLEAKDTTSDIDKNSKHNLENSEENDDSKSPVLSEARGIKFVNKTGAFLKRFFVVYWTRTCALMALLAASFNPSILGVAHLIIGCILVWKNILSPAMYIPMILWLICVTFLPVILSKFISKDPFSQLLLKLLVGEIRSIPGTICLTAWALILFMQPLFIRFLVKLTTPNERQSGLVNFQILPQEQSSLSQTNIESMDNSIKYYISNWFIEFHNEIMLAVLVIATISRKNIYGIIYAILTFLHVIVPLLVNDQGLRALASVSFTLQMFCFISEYCLGFLYEIRNILFDENIFDTNLNPNINSYQVFLGLGDKSHTLLLKSAFGGIYVLLTVRWYLTSRYYQKEKPERRFDTHWCRLCNQVSFKSKHAFSRVKHNIHLYLGWAAHAFLFLTAISTFNHPTVPSVLLLILSLVFFFYGEASILMPALRNQVFVVLGIILAWSLTDSMLTGVAVFILRGKTDEWYVSNNFIRKFLCYFGLTNVLKYWNLKNQTISREAIFDSYNSKIFLGFTIFLILLQIRMYRSKAWPFVLARLYHSYATSAKRAQLFNRNLQATILFQQKKLDSANEHVRKQMASFSAFDISDWKRLCYVPTVDENDDEKLPESKLPLYGTSPLVTTEITSTNIDSTEDRISSDNVSLRKRSTAELLAHLSKVPSDTQENQEHDHLDKINNLSSSDKKAMYTNFEMELSSASVVASDSFTKKEKQKLEGNFYLYTLTAMFRFIVKYILSSCQDYRRLENRPTQKSSMKIIFQHQNIYYRIQFLIQLFIDVINANFDYVIDFLVMEAQIFHSSGFSFLMVVGVLIIGNIQRPFTSKQLHNKLIIICAVWILFNFCMTYIWVSMSENLRALDQNNKLINLSHIFKAFEKVYSHSIFYRIIGIHIMGAIETVTLRPTLILLALSYKRSLMRHLGLWDYGRGIQMAKIYYQTEEDLDDIDELNVSQNYLDDSSTEFSVTDSTNVFMESFEGDGDGAGEESEIESVDLSVVNDKKNLSLITVPTTWIELIRPTEAMPWRDFYVPMFVSDFICLFAMMYFWGDFTLGPIGPLKSSTTESSTFFQEMINQNMIPASLVNMIILSTFILVLDRALYVSKNYIGKFILHILTLIGYHIYVFFYLPQFYAHSDISNMFGLKFWYTFKWIYWISSALQLKYAYPPLRTEPFLASQYGIVSSNLHTMYRSIPFVDELKTIIDWSMTPSSLGLWPWLKFADIYERLYAVQCARAFQRTYFGRHQFGAPANQLSKIMQGIVLVSLSVLILWSPFLIMSQSMAPNDLSSFDLEVTLVNNGPAFLIFSKQQFEDLEPGEFEKLRYANGVNPVEVKEDFFKKIRLPVISQIPWNISASARENAINFLTKNLDEAAEIQVNWKITRWIAQALPIIYGSVKMELNEKERHDLANILDYTSNGNFFMTAKLPNVIPSLIKAPLTEFSFALAHKNHSTELVRICPKVNGKKATIKEIANAAVFLDKNQIPKKNFFKECQFFLRFNDPIDKTKTADETESKDVKNKSQIDIIVYSSKLPKYNFSSFNLVGLYATVVFTVAQLFRMMHADMTTRIQYDDLPNPAPLLILCQQILMMRELGDFVSEEAIYWQVIEILRNPKILIEMTKT